ncbi:MAG: hypothetical protein R3D98_04955 [Candidatus Krumholzibacteriia bacterium]
MSAPGGRSLGVVAAVAAVSLLLGLYLTISGRGGVTFSDGADSFSRSAIGHRGLRNLLQELDVPVLQGRTPVGMHLPDDMVVLLCEPRPDHEPSPAASEERWAAYHAWAWSVVLVLPRWDPLAHPQRPGWIRARAAVPDTVLGRVRSLLPLPARLPLVEAAATSGWHLPDGLAAPDLPAPRLLSHEAMDAQLQPVWWCDQGVLLARLVDEDFADFLVLSDPDLLNNQGLGRGGNAALVMRMLDDLGVQDHGVLIDETLHGYTLAGSPLAAVLRPPLVWITLHVLLLAGLLLWQANAGLGSPRTAVRPGRDGKAFLVANTASLLLVGGHRGHLLRRYLLHALQEVARARRVPIVGTAAELAARLDRLPGLAAPRPGDLCRRYEIMATGHLAPAALLRAARAIHAWKREMLHGDHHAARDGRPAA